MATGVELLGAAVSVSMDRGGGAKAGQWRGPYCTVSWNKGWEQWIVWVKDDMTGNLEEDQGGLSGTRNIFDHVGNDP